MPQAAVRLHVKSGAMARTGKRAGVGARIKETVKAKFISLLSVLTVLVPTLAHAQYQHSGFFNGGTSLTATCTNTTGTKTSSDSFLGTLQGNTVVTLPAASIGCVDYDVIDLRITQGTNQSYLLTVGAGSGTSIKVPSNGGAILTIPPSTGGSTGTVLHQNWVYNAVASTPQWELVTQETQPATLLSIAAGGNGTGSPGI